MGILRRVMAILAVVAALCLGAVLPGAGPAVAGGPDRCTASCRERLVEMGLEGRVVQLVADADSTCALTEQGDVFCWGADPRPYGYGSAFLLLMAIGSTLIAGGATLLLVSRS